MPRPSFVFPFRRRPRRLGPPPLWRVLFTLETDRDTNVKWAPALMIGLIAFLCALPFVVPPLFNALTRRDPTHAAVYRQYSSYAREGPQFAAMYAAFKYGRSVSIRDPAPPRARPALDPGWCSSYLSSSASWMDPSSGLYPSLRKLRLACLDIAGRSPEALGEARIYADDVASGAALLSSGVLVSLRPSAGAAYLDAMLDAADYGRPALASSLLAASSGLSVSWGPPAHARTAPVRTALAAVATPARCSKERSAAVRWRFLRFACGVVASGPHPDRSS